MASHSHTAILQSLGRLLVVMGPYLATNTVCVLKLGTPVGFPIAFFYVLVYIRLSPWIYGPCAHPRLERHVLRTEWVGVRAAPRSRRGNFVLLPPGTTFVIVRRANGILGLTDSGVAVTGMPDAIYTTSET